MSKLKRFVFVLPALVLLAVTIAQNTSRFSNSHVSADSPVSLSVSGNQLIDGFGTPVRLIGANINAGMDCTRNHKPEIYPTTIDQTYVNNMLAWHFNSVRITLNEDCWLEVNGLSPTLSGAAYQSFIENAVSLFNANGMAVILDLIGALPGTQIPRYGYPSGHPTGPLPDSDHSPDFWTSVATTFKSNPGVIFDAYGEPQITSWSCWLNGCTVTSPAGGTYTGVGMQELVNKIRKAGATQPIMLGGAYWSTNLSDWLTYEPTDPLNSLIADFHNYGGDNCSNVTCWNSTIAPLSAQVPLITGEFGEFDCTANFINSYMPWADAHNLSYLAWTWDTDVCTGPALITSYDGTPTVFGLGYKTHLANLWQAGDIINLATNTPNPPGVAATPPTVSITSPTNNALVHGPISSFEATVTANDGGSITNVQLLVDGTSVQTLSSAPYNFALNTLNLPNGSHTIEVEATDDQGLVGSQSISVVVSNGDINQDGKVNIEDLAIMAANWGNSGATYAQGDINGDGVVNINDLAIMANDWGWSQ